MNSSWRTQAACRGEDTDLFFPNGATGPWATQIEQAKTICRRCPVVESCLQYALTTGQAAGVWGGTSEDDRYEHLHGRKRRRPAECGTDSGYYAHRHRQEEICGPCRAAHNAHTNARNARRRQETPA